METNLIQIISACIVLASSLVPLYFILGIRTERQRLLSVILFVVLQAYVVHALIESFDLVSSNYQDFAKVCFIISAFGLMASYSFFQVKTKHTLVGGIFGTVMIASIGVWMIGELVEVIFAPEHAVMEYVGSIPVAVFGIFLIARFFWLRNLLFLEARA